MMPTAPRRKQQSRLSVAPGAAATHGRAGMSGSGQHAGWLHGGRVAHMDVIARRAGRRRPSHRGAARKGRAAVVLCALMLAAAISACAEQWLL